MHTPPLASRSILRSSTLTARAAARLLSVLAFGAGGVGMIGLPAAAHAQCPLTFAPANYAFHFPINAPTLTTGDLNNDGRLDIVAATPSEVVALLGNGTGTFTRVSTLTNDGIFGVVHSSAVGDFNGDGKLDIVICYLDSNTTAGIVSVRLGTGTGSFSAPIAEYNIGGSIAGGSSGWYTVATAHLNGDGILDLAVSVPNSAQAGGIATVAVMLGVGTGLFGAPTSFPLPFTLPSGVAPGAAVRGLVIGDLNGDSRPDLAVTHGRADDIAVLLGTGTGSFGPATVFDTSADIGGSSRDLAIGDLNGDGIPDLAVANVTPTGFDRIYGASMLPGTGTGSFGTPIPLFTTNTSFLRLGSVDIADFNGDGTRDVVYGNILLPEAMVFLGTGGGSFALPTSYTMPGIGACNDIVVGDFNEDGKPDVAAATSSNATATSSYITVLLNTSPGNPAPVFVLQPVSQIVQAGASASLTASANFVQGSAPYRWRRNGQPLFDGGNISGATTTTLTINPVSASDEAVYDLRVTSPTCLGGQVTGTSAPAVLAVTNSNANCLAADVGLQGGIPGHDGLLNNNDFIVFIDNFFNQTQCP